MTEYIVGVSPESALAARPRLFQALAEALDVQFVAATSRAQLAATVHFGEEPKHSDGPTLILGTGSGAPVGESAVLLSDSKSLDGHLRGWTINDDTVLGMRHLEPDQNTSTLATVAGLPVWTTRTGASARVDHAILMPAELDQEETLRSRITPGRFLELLPLVLFLRSLAGDDRWHRPPVRASFIMDDPNLHAGRYGYISYDKIVNEALETGFHLSVAMIPLDTWFTSRKTANRFRSHPDQLSLLYHGNNHTRHELGEIGSREHGLEVLAQSVRRMQRFERRHGIPVARVMAAPHGRCSEDAAWAMAHLGFEAICMTRPFPWREEPAQGRPLVGWHPADTYSAMPTVQRMPLSSRPEEIALRAFLGQPIVLYGHDPDLGPQPDLLTRWVGHVGRLDGVKWASVGDISREQVTWRSDGETLWVRPHTRLVSVLAPAGIERIVVDGGGIGYETTVITDAAGVVATVRTPEAGTAIDVTQHPRNLTISTQPESVVNPDDVSAPRWTPWAPTRRLLTEARDRFRPVTDKRRR